MELLKQVLIELNYTQAHAEEYHTDKHRAISPYVDAAKASTRKRIRINADRDLDLNNLEFFPRNIPGLLEVSIGHALISDALYLGYEKCCAAIQKAIKNYIA